MQVSATPFGVRSRTRRLTVTVLTFVALVVSMLVLVPSAEAARRSAAPSAVRVVSARTSLSVAWSAASRSGTFRVRVSAKRSMAHARVRQVRGARATIRGLAAGRHYFVTVQAVHGRTGRATGTSRVVPATTSLSQRALVSAPRSAAPAPTPTWLSGASGDGVVDGSFGAWRGRPVEIAGTWNDNYASQEREWSLMPSFSFGSWQGNLDDAVGGIYKDRGESWAAAADGAYDVRWRNTLVNLADAWKGRPGTLYIRFAHEFNGEWYPWSVKGSEAEDFKTAWKRFRSLQREIFPAAKLVFCPTAETSGSLSLDWRKAFPGRDQVDVVSVDYYNQWPFVSTVAEFGPAMDRTDALGAPRGLERHRQFAESVGEPFAISEWSSNALQGDSPAFMSELHKWLTAHAGRAAGQVLYEIQFNAPGFSGAYHLYPTTLQPQATATYRRLW